MNRCLAGAASLAAIATCSGAAGATERQLVLEVILNGRSTGRVAEFVERDGELLGRAADLREIGLLVSASAADELIAITRISGLEVRIDEMRQVLLATAIDKVLRPNEVRGQRTTVKHAEPTVPQLGAVLNYDMVGTLADGDVSGGVLLDARVFSGRGVVQATALTNLNPSTGQRRFVRLDTTYSFSDPSNMRRVRIGDVISGTFQSGRPVRMGGIQLSSDFNLRPDLITYPLPVISASAAVPSTVAVLVNGARQYDQRVEQGPFRVHAPPMVNGAGEVAIAIQDAVGRQTLITRPFYASSTLLRPGFSSYSAEVGFVRRDFGLDTDHYANWAANGSFRYGVFDHLTLEAHGEASDGLVLAGGGVNWKIGALGLLNAAVSVSRDRAASDESSEPRSGSQASNGFERRSQGFNVSLAGSWASAGYRDIASNNGDPVVRRMLNVSIGRSFDQFGTLGLAYVYQAVEAENWGNPDGQRQSDKLRRNEFITFGYNVPIARSLSFRASGYKDFAHQSYSLGIGFSMLLDRNTNASVSAATEAGRESGYFRLSKTARQQGDFGFQLQNSEGARSGRSATGEYLDDWGRVEAGADQSSSGIATRAGLRGAVVWAGGGLFLSDHVQDSFAVVRTGGVAGVPVLYENRLVGRTGWGGMLLVPSLLSYQDNRLAVDTASLPADVEVGQTATTVRPYDRAGVVVEFQVKAVTAAVVTLHDPQGARIPLGSTARINGEAGRPVGHDGQTYLTDLKTSNQLIVELPDGTSCSARFDHRATEGDVPLIGPVVCQ